jgi:hypothetical protein
MVKTPIGKLNEENEKDSRKQILVSSALEYSDFNNMMGFPSKMLH